MAHLCSCVVSHRGNSFPRRSASVAQPPRVSYGESSSPRLVSSDSGIVAHESPMGLTRNPLNEDSLAAFVVNCLVDLQWITYRTSAYFPQHEDFLVASEDNKGPLPLHLDNGVVSLLEKIRSVRSRVYSCEGIVAISPLFLGKPFLGGAMEAVSLLGFGSCGELEAKGAEAELLSCIVLVVGLSSGVALSWKGTDFSWDYGFMTVSGRMATPGPQSVS
ncbi:uncharacterized protein G2W53_027196 [Senna tora]|uniref:Uncharacterized protein n=1 Tax=Senna tora TaxID=362788 RepID=A0A834TIW7_9FABA|nr:uncharacterized protein G2W53_027196 [Senna tora]